MHPIQPFSIMVYMWSYHRLFLSLLSPVAGPAACEARQRRTGKRHTSLQSGQCWWEQLFKEVTTPYQTLQGRTGQRESKETKTSKIIIITIIFCCKLL